MARTMNRTLSAACTVVAALFLASCAATVDEQPPLVLTIVGTNDVHGQLLPREGAGGLATLSGYVEALRATQDEVLLIDAGDMWQGTLESNVNEGAAVTEAYNAMGFVAAAVGNHEFDFGPVGELSMPQGPDDDARGALKARAREMNFPLLSANLLDANTGELVDWDNLSASIVVEAGGIEVGIVGATTEDALVTTIPANVRGLEMAPLAASIEREALTLREKGADLIVVAAHAGGRCEKFDDPDDTSSCNPSGEIMRAAEALPPGLVDHIIAGHIDEGIAHVVNGIAITLSYSRTEAFSRVDFLIDRTSGEIVDRIVYPPQPVCPAYDVADDTCVWIDDGRETRPAVYEGRTVVPDPAVVEIVARADRVAGDVKAESLGASVDIPLTLKGNPESLLGNMFTDAVLASFDGDISVHNVTGGIRAILPAGDITFGEIYEIMPFDNRVVILELTGAELRQIVANQLPREYRKAGFSGMRIAVSCENDVLDIDLELDDGRSVSNDDVLRVVANDFLALGGDSILSPVMPDGGFEFDSSLPLVRDSLVEFLRGRGDIEGESFSTAHRPKWSVPADCADGGS